MIRKSIFLVFLIAVITLPAGCQKSGTSTKESKTVNKTGGGASKDTGSVTETGTSMAGASVVRSAVLELSGAINGRMEAPDDESTFLRGNCPPDTWANFGIQFEHPGYQWVAVTVMTKKPIGPGQTGPVKLDWLDVSLVDKDMHSLFFRGPGSLEIKVHDATAGHRRMTGVIKGTGLEGSQDAEGKTLDAEFEFDMNFSCGVK